MWLMLQQPAPDDYVIATGVSHSVRDLVEIAFARVGLDWQKYVKTDPKFLRPAEVDHLIGDPSKARKVLGWDLKVDFKQLVEMMVDADVERLKRTTEFAKKITPSPGASPMHREPLRPSRPDL
jgi:GDPmannose 4,6-dehydratase